MENLLKSLMECHRNTTRHTPPGTAISLQLEHSPDGAVATISDNGPGIPEDQIDEVFEHFYRLDTARASPGNGLGLALVAAIAKLHHLHLKLQDGNPGLQVVIEFPTPANK